MEKADSSSQEKPLEHPLPEELEKVDPADIKQEEGNMEKADFSSQEKPLEHPLPQELEKVDPADIEQEEEKINLDSYSENEKSFDMEEEDEKDPDFDARQSYQQVEHDWGEIPNENQSDDLNAIKLKSEALAEFKPQVIFIGAGPVGLWVAIQLKLHFPKLRILMLDKYAVFQRSHLLRIVRRSLKNVHKDLKDFKEWALGLTGKIRTNDLEKRLWEKASELGIKKEVVAVKNPLELKEIFPSVNVIIGTDGSHSVVRHEVFGNRLAVKQTLEHVAFCKYEAVGKVNQMKNIKEQYAALKLIKHLVLENVGREKDGVTPVTLQIKIDAETYKKMEGARFKTPYNITTDKPKYEPKLLETITAWLNMREIYQGEKRVKGSAKVNVIGLDVYKAETVAQYFEDKDLAVFLCGDAAFGVPFFRALNDGLLFGSVLASSLFEQKNIKDAVKAYSKYFHKIANLEIMRAKALVFSHKAAEKYVKFNAAIPWQFFSVKDKKKDILKPLPDVEEDS